jgi:hypothetical protein
MLRGVEAGHGRGHVAPRRSVVRGTHDCFTIAGPIEYEAIGLARSGDGARVLEGITIDGKLTVNASGA